MGNETWLTPEDVARWRIQAADPRRSEGTRSFKAVNYKPCSTKQVGRYRFISQHLKGTAVVILNATQEKAAKGEEGVLKKTDLDDHVSHSFKHVPSPFTNRSCGGSILLSKDTFGRRPWVECQIKASANLTGGCGGLVARIKQAEGRIGSCASVAVGIIYWPPAPPASKGK